ncbi:MAG: hypothetical protein NXI22_02105 [bacterium]|nr:hypothetical protein [bacterium]
MSIHRTIEESFRRSFGLYQDFIAAIDDAALDSKLLPLPSNTLGQQLWCVVGARESFNKAIAANQWLGFSCSLQETASKESVADALQTSADQVAIALETINEYSEVQQRLIIDLLEHEAAHHGQLIRYIYGLQLPIPDSWKSKYALKEL